MGVTHWQDQNRQETLIVKSRGTKGAYYYGNKIVKSKRSAILHIITRSEFVVMEQGMGARANVVNAQAKQRGYIEAICDEFKVDYREIKPTEWRKPIKEHVGVTWPRRTEDMKALSQQIVQRLYGMDVGEDEADSVLIGVGASCLGFVPNTIINLKELL